MKRKGLGSGLGRGYYNILPMDSYIHSLSAKGIKSQMQKLYAKKTLTETEKAIIGMLKENTGRHMLDSGDAYGRHWEKNQAIDFKDTKPVKWDEYGAQVSTYHFLKTFLELTPKAKKYQKMYDKMFANSDEPYLADMENFAEYLDDNDISVDDEYLVGDHMNIINSYNEENLLSQVLQYGMFYDGKDYFVVLQIHGGTDVRGGYTAPKIFELKEDPSYWFTSQTDLTVVTKDGKTYDTDDTYHFYPVDDTSGEPLEWEDLYEKGIKEVIPRLDI